MKFEQILSDLQRKLYYPVYFLQGEEDYFIDKISDFIEEKVLDASEKDFNQTVLYGIETDVENILSIAKRYPMMASHNVVIVKEAQNLKKLDGLDTYFENPSSTTILVLNYKYKKLDKRKKTAKLINSKGVFFTSDKFKDYQALPWIEKYVKEKKLNISPKAAAILLSFLGVNFAKIANEIDKLTIVLKEGEEITDEIIEENIGISKDYNIFELNNAIGQKDILKANRIINHFSHNPKIYPLPILLSGLYRFFSKLLLFHYIKDKKDNEIAASLGVNPFFLKDYKSAARHFPVKKLARIISYLRECDNRSKGIGNTSIEEGNLLKELLFKILH